MQDAARCSLLGKRTGTEINKTYLGRRDRRIGHKNMTICFFFVSPSTEVVVDKGGAAVTSRIPCRFGERNVGSERERNGMLRCRAKENRVHTGSVTPGQSVWALDLFLLRRCLSVSLCLLCLDWLGMGPLLFFLYSWIITLSRYLPVRGSGGAQRECWP